MITKDRLRQRRKELGLSMKEVAAKIGVSEATVSRWESGDIANMKRNYIQSYADALGVSPLFIMGLEDTSDTFRRNYEAVVHSSPEVAEAVNVLFSSVPGATEDELIQTAKFLEYLKGSRKE